MLLIMAAAISPFIIAMAMVSPWKVEAKLKRRPFARLGTLKVLPVIDSRFLFAFTACAKRANAVELTGCVGPNARCSKIPFGLHRPTPNIFLGHHFSHFSRRDKFAAVFKRLDRHF